MSFNYQARQFHPDELDQLKSIKADAEKNTKARFKFWHYLIAGILGVVFTLLAIEIKTGFLVFVFGTLAVFSYAFILFVPYEMYKLSKERNNFSTQLTEFIKQEKVATCTISAKRIAVAKETEDEGDLYIIEYENDKVLYLFDYGHNLIEGFPCLEFELYETKFSKLLGTDMYAKSSTITPIAIDTKKMWSYFEGNGAPEHLSTESLDFNKFVADYNTSA